MNQIRIKQKEKPDIRELTIKNGLEYPSDEELIMLILGSGTKAVPIEQLAEKVLDVISVSNFSELINALLAINGIGTGKALAIAAAIELGRRLNRSPQATINKPIDIIPYVQHFSMKTTEHFVCVTMNGSREILAIRVICAGSGNMAILHPRDIFCEAVKERASAVILCHNHPGGNKMPSEDDIHATKEIAKCAKILGIALLDHIIITRTGYFSFLENNILPEDEA